MDQFAQYTRKPCEKYGDMQFDQGLFHCSKETEYSFIVRRES